MRNFLRYLGADYPEVNRLEQLRREPHILGWMSRMRSQKPPLATVTCIGRLIALRGVFNELAWSNKHSELARLIRREDIPRTPHRLPRPLTAEQDQLLQQEFLRRNDLGGNVFLLIRHTGMRIGECVDLSFDCLRSTGPNQWAIHVPLGKLKTERMVPVDASTVNSFNAFGSFVPWILCPPMGGSWPVQAANMRSFVDCAITCMRSAIHLTSPSASSRTSFGIRMPQRCFGLV